MAQARPAGLPPTISVHFDRFSARRLAQDELADGERALVSDRQDTGQEGWLLEVVDRRRRI
jgi:hypothetical protein